MVKKNEMEITVCARIIHWIDGNKEDDPGEPVTYQKKFKTVLTLKRHARMINERHFKIYGMRFERIRLDPETGVFHMTSIERDTAHEELLEDSWEIIKHEEV